MKAVQIHHYGGPEALVYEDAPMPKLNDDDVLIKVEATSVNPVDWKVRSGLRKDPNRHFPLILGWDVSGVIERVGGNVTDFKPGDGVYSRPDVTRNGAYAEYIAVRASEVALKPQSLEHNEAAAVPLAGLTAWQGLFDHGKLQMGQKVLIQGASGGVGTIAVQLAKWSGAYVIGTASAKNVEFLRQLGADEVIDYQKEHFENKLHNIDLVFDTIGGDTQIKSLNVLKPDGILVSTVGIKDEEMVKARGIKGVAYMAQSSSEQLHRLAQLIDEGRLIPVISRTFPLREAANAQRESEEGHTRGKIVLTLAGFLCGIALVATMGCNNGGRNQGGDSTVAKTPDTTITTNDSSNGQRNETVLANRKDSTVLDKKDAHFLENAYQGGMFEVQLGQIATNNASNPKVRAFGTWMVQDHGSGDTTLKNLAAAKGLVLPDSVSGSQKHERDRLFNKYNADFDADYVKSMVSDHTSDIKEFEDESINGQDPDVRAFAEKMLRTLHMHLDQAQALQKTVQQ